MVVALHREVAVQGGIHVEIANLVEQGHGRAVEAPGPGEDEGQPRLADLADAPKGV